MWNQLGVCMYLWTPCLGRSHCSRRPKSSLPLIPFIIFLSASPPKESWRAQFQRPCLSVPEPWPAFLSIISCSSEIWIMYSCQTSFLLSLEGDTAQIVSQETVISWNLYLTPCLILHLASISFILPGKNFAHPTKAQHKEGCILFDLSIGGRSFPWPSLRHNVSPQILLNSYFIFLSFIHLPIHQIIRYLLNTHYKPGTSSGKSSKLFL